eukprot:scaffold46616_cov44-Prasinocladus_malaysianus.AAC.3
MTPMLTRLIAVTTRLNMAPSLMPRDRSRESIKTTPADGKSSSSGPTDTLRSSGESAIDSAKYDVHPLATAALLRMYSRIRLVPTIHEASSPKHRAQRKATMLASANDM